MSKGNKMDQAALRYHSEGRPGKIAVVPTKPYHTQHDLSLAYSPGVAAPCRAIEANPDDVYRYTNQGNLIAVISNGTAVLGLGNIGALAGKPVMEGKSMLFKTFADIDAIRHRSRIRNRPRSVHPHGQGHRPDLRRHQPRRHQGSGVLRNRPQAERRAGHPRDARRPARHGRDLDGRAAQCGENRRQSARHTPRRSERRRCGGHRVRAALHRRRRPPRKLIFCDSQGVVTTYRTDINEIKRNSPPPAASPPWPKRSAAPTYSSACRSRRADARNGAHDGANPIVLRWPIPIRRSPTTTPSFRVPTSSLRRAARTIPIR